MVSITAVGPRGDVAFPNLSPAPAGGFALPRLAAHRVAWFRALLRGFRHSGWLLTAESDGETRGLLPLVLVRGPLFGRFLVSLPYVNTGGIWAADEEAARSLADAACELADRQRVRFLELRHEVPLGHPAFNHHRTEKQHLRLNLPDSDEALDRSFKSKLRSQIRKSAQYGLEVTFGGAECLNDFYDVFAVNMRDLGTPVFGKRLFTAVLEEFQGDAEICLVRSQTRPVAAALLVHAGGVTEVPSASSLRDWNHTNANMLMYRHLLRRAIGRGSGQFDFGRSSEGSGTYRFKRQWGAEPFPAVWQYYVRSGSPEEMRPEAAGKRRLVRIWQRLPVGLTRLIGPPIVRGIP